MESLDKSINLAALKVAASNKKYIVYKTTTGFKFIDAGFRKGTYEAILIPSGFKTIVKDANGKIIKTIDRTPEKIETKAKKETKPVEDKPNKAMESLDDKAVQDV